jgi:putative ABC transport system permease protein
VFTLLFLFTSFQSYRVIYKYKLIELFKADFQGEKRIKASAIAAICSILFLILSYVLAASPLPRGNTNILTHTAIILFGVMIGTYLFFHSFVAYVLKLLQGNKSYHYRGTNMIGTSQLQYRMKGNTRTFTVIALLSALTISFLGAIFAQYQSFEQSSKEFAPFSYTHLSKGASYDEKIKKLITEDTNHPVIVSMDIPIIEAPTAYKAPKNYKSNPVKIISSTTYQNVTSALYQEQTLILADDEAVVIQPHLAEHTFSNYSGQKITLNLGDTERTFNFTDITVNRVMTWDYPDFFIIINDTAFQEISKEISPLIFKAYEVENEKKTKATSDKLMLFNPGDTNVFSGNKDNTQLYSYYSVYQTNLENSAMNVFVVGFLGLIFLAATGSIIYFKQLTEATESKLNYEILKKIGVSKKEILVSVAKQNLFIFVMPLIIGITNSIILLSFLTKFLSDLIGIDISNSLIISILSFITIYIGYYLLTVNTYNKIANDTML